MCNIWEHCFWVENASVVSALIVFGLFGLGLWKLMWKKPDVNAGVFWLYLFFGLFVAAFLWVFLAQAIENSFGTLTPI